MLLPARLVAGGCCAERCRASATRSSALFGAAGGALGGGGVYCAVVGVGAGALVLAGAAAGAETGTGDALCRFRWCLPVQGDNGDEREEAGRPGKAAVVSRARPQAAAVTVDAAVHAVLRGAAGGLLRCIFALTLPSSRLSSMVS